MFVTPEEHEQGWKQVEVTLRSGKTDTVTLTAPTRAQFRQLQKRLAQAGKEAPDELYELTVIALGEQAPMVDKLDAISAQRVESIVIEMTYGSAFMDRFSQTAVQAAASEATEVKTNEGATDPNAPAPGKTA